MLAPGDPVPDVSVWFDPREETQPLRDVLGPGLTLLAFFPFAWSPT